MVRLTSGPPALRPRRYSSGLMTGWLSLGGGGGRGALGEALPKSGGTFVVGSLWTSAPKAPSGDSVILKRRQDLAALGQQLS